MQIAIFKSLQIRINTGFVQNVHFLCDILKLAYREFTFILHNLHICRFSLVKR